MSTKIARINQIAKEKPKEVFTSIYHLINYELLKECFDRIGKGFRPCASAHKFL